MLCIVDFEHKYSNAHTVCTVHTHLLISYVRVYSIDSLSLFLRNIDKVHAGIGDKFAMLIQWVTTFIAGFVVGFIRGWQLALLLAFITPIMGVAGAVFFRVRRSCMIIMMSVHVH